MRAPRSYWNLTEWPDHILDGNMKALLIDDHALFRAGLSGLLERRGIEVVASVGCGDEGIGALEILSPDIILLDLRMPKRSGLDVLDALPTEQSDVPVAILTTSADENDLANALRKGARGYLMKDMEPDDLVVALQAVSYTHLTLPTSDLV